MKGLIHLTTNEKTDIWINPEYISTMVRTEVGNGSIIYIGELESPIIVTESPEDVIQKITVSLK